MKPEQDSIHRIDRDPIPADDDKTVIQNAILTHALPFVVWLMLMTMLPAAGWSYALRSGICLGLLFWLAPWRWYPRLQLKNLPLAVITGVIVCLVWIAPESRIALRIPGFQSIYELLFMLPPWSTPEPLESSPYAPEVCGWTFTVVRLLGSAIVVGMLEEFFWRGFLYRWMFKSNFLAVDPGHFQATMFFAVAVLFGLEHTRWLVGILAGIAYGWMYIHTKDIWSVCIAHAITNLLLGIYAIATHSYQFW
jgi:hypothetical protein